MKRQYVSSLAESCYHDAEKLLGETIASRNHGLAEIERWLCKEQPNIHMQNDVRYIIYFLRTTKYDVDKAKRKIFMYFKIRADRTEWFQNRDPFLPELQELLDIGVFLPLRQKDAHNRQVVIIRTAAHNPKRHSQDNVFKVDKMILDLLLYLDETISIYGIVAIFDMKHVTLSHALQLPPSLIKRTVESWENYPCRPQLLEFVNAPIHVNVVLNVFRRGTHVSKVVNLPPELGGTGDSYHDLTEHWKRKVQEHAFWFAETEQFKLHLS
ncbi:retinol-binding protein pinta isoform X2 [Topomyia yanbarensis]|uniref:retinol-binding protein pinta isoform X2 n=1 Tax=Topomyia yanbarensis TaxID=2498891 RepID=UPI00273C1ACE|nr:retinol-binding protein pinta isoform X2 [Topomyia yanbarensis]